MIYWGGGGVSPCRHLISSSRQERFVKSSVLPIHRPLRTEGGAGVMYVIFSTQSHGFEHMLTFHNLKQLGLLEEREAAPSSKPLGKVAAITSLQRSSAFRALSKKLNLVRLSDSAFHVHRPSPLLVLLIIGWCCAAVFLQISTYLA